MNVECDLSDPETYRDGQPWELFRALRRDDPVAWRELPSGGGFWAVTRHADVVHVLKNPHDYSSWRGTILIQDPPPAFLTTLRESMINRDPPDHTAMRRLVNHAFSPRRVDALGVRIAQHCRILLDRLDGRDACDVVTDLAAELPLFVICEILGVPVEDRNLLFGYTRRMLEAHGEDRALAVADQMAAAAAMRAYGAELGRDKRLHPADDLVSDLLAAEIHGRRLDEGEFQAFFMLLFNAGADTTKGLVTQAIDVLVDRPDDYARLVADPELVPTAIEEILRWSPQVIQVRRTATRALELGGRAIAEGDRVVVFFGSANRDEAVFEDPDRFDITRNPNPHVAFGYGAHYCLGAPLARMESRHMLTQLVARFPRIERLGPRVGAPSNFVNAVKSLPVALHRA